MYTKKIKILSSSKSALESEIKLANPVETEEESNAAYLLHLNT